MNSESRLLIAPPYSRPQKLYRYSQRQWLERSLQLGEFRLRPASQPQVESTTEQILPFGPRQPAHNYLILSLANAWDEKLFDAFSGADCCLVIHDAEQFGERLHRAVQRVLPSWAGIDAPISYGMPSPLGAAFSKTRHYAMEKEWLFAWRPMRPELASHPVVVRVGNIAQIAELRERGV